MKRAIAEDGTRTHELSAAENGTLRKAIIILEKIAFFHRNTLEGSALTSLVDQLQFIHDGETLVAEAPPMTDA